MRWRRFDVDCTVCEICSATTAFAELSPPVAAVCVDIGRHNGLRLFAAVTGSCRRRSIFSSLLFLLTLYFFFTAHNFLLNFISSMKTHESWSTFSIGFTVQRKVKNKILCFCLKENNKLLDFFFLRESKLLDLQKRKYIQWKENAKGNGGI